MEFHSPNELSGQSHHTFVQISLAQDTSWAETHLRGGLELRLGDFSPHKPRPGYVPEYCYVITKSNTVFSVKFGNTKDSRCFVMLVLLEVLRVDVRCI